MNFLSKRDHDNYCLIIGAIPATTFMQKAKVMSYAKDKGIEVSPEIWDSKAEKFITEN